MNTYTIIILKHLYEYVYFRFTYNYIGTYKYDIIHI